MTPGEGRARAAGDPGEQEGGQAALQQEGQPGHEVAKGLAGVPGQVGGDPLELSHHNKTDFDNPLLLVAKR